jgi:hypothetical protein
MNAADDAPHAHRIEPTQERIEFRIDQALPLERSGDCHSLIDGDAVPKLGCRLAIRTVPVHDHQGNVRVLSEGDLALHE